MENSKIDWTKISWDVNGNPRYVCDYSYVLNENDKLKAKSLLELGKFKYIVDAEYHLALKKANTIGGKKYHNKKYAFGIVFQSYNLDYEERAILKLKNTL